MNEFPLVYTVLLFLSGISGLSLLYFRTSLNGQGLRLLLAFSAAYLLGLCFLHLLPEIFESVGGNAGWFILGGFLLQVILDFFSHGVEHGHAHIHQQRTFGFLLPVIISLWVHAFIEGMPFGGSWAGHSHHVHDHVHAHGEVGHDHRNSLIVGIGLHKITEAMVFCALLVGSGMKRGLVVLWVGLFACIAPLGCVTQFYLGSSGIIDIAAFTPKITAVLVGIMIHVATTIIFEGSEGHHFNLRKFLAILAGLAFSALATYA